MKRGLNFDIEEKKKQLSNYPDAFAYYNLKSNGNTNHKKNWDFFLKSYFYPNSFYKKNYPYTFNKSIFGSGDKFCKPKWNAITSAVIFAIKYEENKTERNQSEHYKLLDDLLKLNHQHANTTPAIRAVIYAQCKELLKELLLHPKTDFYNQTSNVINTIVTELHFFNGKDKDKLQSETWNVVLSLIDLERINSHIYAMAALEIAVRANCKELLQKLLLKPEANFRNEPDSVIQAIYKGLPVYKKEKEIELEKEYWDEVLNLIKQNPPTPINPYSASLINHSRLNDPSTCLEYFFNFPLNALKEWMKAFRIPTTLMYGAGWVNLYNFFKNIRFISPDNNLDSFRDLFEHYQKCGGPDSYFPKLVQMSIEQDEESKKIRDTITEQIKRAEGKAGNDITIRSEYWFLISELMTPGNLVFTHLKDADIKMLRKYLSTHPRDCLKLFYNLNTMVDYLNNYILGFELSCEISYCAGWMKSAKIFNIFPEPSFDDLHTLYQAIHNEGDINWRGVVDVTYNFPFEPTYNKFTGVILPPEMWNRIFSYVVVPSQGPALLLEVTSFITQHYFGKMKEEYPLNHWQNKMEQDNKLVGHKIIE